MNCYPVKLIKPLSEHKIFLWIAVSWTVFVTYCCLVDLNSLPDSGDLKQLDKPGHMGFHFGITLFWYLYFRFQKEFLLRKAILCAVAFSLAFGISIELIQAFCTTNRSGDLLDVCANATGSLLAIVLVASVGSIRNGMRNPQP